MKRKIRLALTALCSGIVLLAPALAPAQTGFTTDPETRTWNIFSNGQTLGQIRSQLNGRDLFASDDRIAGRTERPAPSVRTAKTAEFQTTIDGLRVTTHIEVKNSRWVQLSVAVYNPGPDTLHISSFEPLSASCGQALKGASAEDLRMMWESATYEVGRAKDHDSYYYTALYDDKHRQGTAWMISYAPPQLWTSMIEKQGDHLTAFVNFRGRPFPVDPGETIRFDPILVSAEFNAMAGWQAIGKLYTPTRLSASPAASSGFNTWDFYRGAISTAALSPVLDSLQYFNKVYPARLRYFTLDDGWFAQRGSWEFDTAKFAGGEAGWAQRVHAAGMVPGVWISPFWSNKDRVDEYHMTVQEEVPTHVIRYRVDPSDPNVRNYVIGRFRELSRSGYKYFKIDFLALAYTDRPFRYSKFPPERVIREFLLEIRKAIGDDAYLLGCSTVVAPCATVCDGARIMSDITENWEVTKDIYLRIAYRYWMNGNLFDTDPDFFVGRGPETLKQNAFPGYALESGDRQYQGFDYTKAKTWAAMCFALGGLVNWGDQPAGVRREIWNLAAVLAEYGPGKPGIPLDLMDTEQPTKWLRTSNGHTYIVLINTAANPVTVVVHPGEAGKLSGPAILKDIFTHAEIRHPGGDLVITLKPFDSGCLEIQ